MSLPTPSLIFANARHHAAFSLGFFGPTRCIIGEGVESYKEVA